MDTINQAMKIWKAFSKEVTPIQPELNNIDVKTLIGNLFCPGPWYSFKFEINQGHFSYMHSNAKEFYGKDENDIILTDLIDRIHPDDHNFFLESEALVADFLTEKINPQEMFKYKFVYSYRFRIPNGEYRHLLHQCIAFARGEKGNMITSFGVHAFIDHITPKSNYKLSIIGMDEYPSYFGITVPNPKIKFQPLEAPFSPREIEIIRLISEGLSSREIAASLFISHATARTHRQNILDKAKCQNTTALVAKCFQLGIL
jgi:DNA-binding CsgD family transcriptional regulator